MNLLNKPLFSLVLEQSGTEEWHAAASQSCPMAGYSAAQGLHVFLTTDLSFDLQIFGGAPVFPSYPFHTPRDLPLL